MYTYVYTCTYTHAHCTTLTLAHQSYEILKKGTGKVVKQCTEAYYNTYMAYMYMYVHVQYVCTLETTCIHVATQSRVTKGASAATISTCTCTYVNVCVCVCVCE